MSLGRQNGDSTVNEKQKGIFFQCLASKGSKSTPCCSRSASFRQPLYGARSGKEACRGEKGAMQQQQNKSLKMENLVVFDFDNTLIDGNTDSVIIDMFPDLKTTARTYRSEGKGWGETMHSILDKISGKHGRTREHIDSCIYQLEIPKTVKQMFSRIVNLKKSDLIIVSHSNEYFIDILLNMADINKSTFKNILTYPAVWTDKGSLEVQRFHSHVIDCAYCPNDFCKGHVLSDAIKKLEEAQRKQYLTKIYIGDGTADYCGAASLNRDDYVLCREGYSLQKLIFKHQNHLHKKDSSQNFPKCKSWSTFEEMEANLLSLLSS